MTNRARWLFFVGVSLPVLFPVDCVWALPSQRCETIEIVDHEGMSRELGIPELVELLKTVPLTIVPKGVPADVRLDLTFSSASSSIHAAIRSWAETESAGLESGRVRWIEDFKAFRRTIQPMEENEAEAFRQQIVAELKKYVEARTAAVVVASEPEGLPIVTTVPKSPAPPLNRNRTAAVLGCLHDGAEIEGYVAWPDGRRESFARRASQTPERFIVGSRASTERPPAPEHSLAADARAAEPVPPVVSGKPASSRSWYWWLGAPLALLLVFVARALVKKR